MVLRSDHVDGRPSEYFVYHLHPPLARVGCRLWGSLVRPDAGRGALPSRSEEGYHQGNHVQDRSRDAPDGHEPVAGVLPADADRFQGARRIGDHLHGGDGRHGGREPAAPAAPRSALSQTETAGSFRNPCRHPRQSVLQNDAAAGAAHSVPGNGGFGPGFLERRAGAFRFEYAEPAGSRCRIGRLGEETPGELRIVEHIRRGPRPRSERSASEIEAVGGAANRSADGEP
ncbi:MAG: hypothetical protein BWY77_01856 [bacterium ADurb.Bin431]|nr:MAG: hypothetical protein BWY77_01856 [bacterium ADurb.Bin431]